MTSVAASTSVEMSAASSFSYAQAAKGQSATASNTSNTPAEKAQEPQVPATEAQVTASDAPLGNTADAVEPVPASDTRLQAPEKQDADATQGSEGDSKSQATSEKQTESKRDDEVSRLDRPWRRNDKATRSSSAATRSADDQDSRKGRRGKKSKAPTEKQAGEQTAAATDKEQDAEPEPPKIELAEAPIPSVNIWHQRKEAHQAKGKAPSANSIETSNGVLEEPKTSAKAADDSARDVAAPVNGVKTQRKAADTNRPERNGPRGSRWSAEKEARDGKGSHPPPVADASSWPTPETAIKEVTRKNTDGKSVDRSDRSDKDSQEDGQSRSRQKKEWVAYDYVPSVSFETHVPQMRGAKQPRGGARGTRDTGAARATAAAEKTTAAPTSKANETKDRAKEADTSGRAASLPPAAKRTPLDAGNPRDQKKAAAQGTSEKAKDPAPPTATTQAPRDRPDGRGERGRGGYRGRGGHHSQAQHQHSASAASAAAFGGSSSASRPLGPYSPPPRQGGHGGMFMPPPQRGRGGRNGAASNFHRMSLPNGSSRVAPVQTQFGAYDFPVAPMTAMPFQSGHYWENMFVPMLRSQIEYYFSIENLCKDMYLRQRMDSQGFVPLHFVAAFKRMQDLSGDINLIRAVCEESTEVDYIVGEDDCERLRRRDGWQKFVLPLEERDELARNNGPAHITYKNRSYQYGSQFHGMPPMHYGVTSPPPFIPSHDAPIAQYSEFSHSTNGVNGTLNGNGVSQLSAEVPDFSPSGSAIVGGVDTEKLKAAVSKNPIPGASASQDTEQPTTNGVTNGVHAHEGDATQS